MLKLHYYPLFNLVFTGLAILCLASLVFAVESPNKIEEEAVQKSKVWTETSVKQSHDLFIKTAKIWLIQNDFKKAAHAFRNAGSMSLILNLPKDAYAYFKQSLRLETENNNIKGQIESLSYLTIAALKTKKTEEAENLSKQSIKKLADIDDPILTAKAFFSASEVAYYKNNIPEMIVFLEKAIILFREADNKVGEAECLTNLAYGYIMNNNRIKGKDYAYLAVEIQRKLNNTRGLAFSLIALGDSYARMGQWQQAFIFFNQAKNLFPEKLDYFEKAILFDRFGLYYETFNDLTLAKKSYQKALELFDAIEDESGTSQLLSVLGEISLQLGDEDSAFKFFNKSLEISIRSADPVAQGLVARKIGDAYQNQGNYKLALSHYRSALKTLEKVGIKHTIADVYKKIGTLFLNQSNLSQAKKYFTLASHINKEILDKFELSNNYYNLALVEKSRNNIDFAIIKVEDSLRITETLYSDVTNNTLKRSYFSNVFDRYEIYIYLLMQKYKKELNPNLVLQALKLSEKSRSRSMLEKLILSEAKLTKDASPETVTKENEIHNLLNINSNKLIELLSQSANQIEIESISSKIKELEHELEEIKAELKQKSPIYSAIKNPESFDLTDFQQNILDDNSILLEFSLGEEESYLWLVSKTNFSHVILPGRKNIEASIEKIHQTFTSRQPSQNEDIETYLKRSRDAEDVYNQEISLLSKEILEPIAEKIANKRLIIVPDGKLTLLPFATLIHPITKQPLIHNNEIVYQPSATFLSFLTKLKNKNNPPQKDLLVFADPVFSDDDVRLNIKPKNEVYSPGIMSLNLRDFNLMDENGRISRLFASQGEAESITKIVGTTQTSIISGFEANRERVLNSDLSNYKILHFATHGLVDVKRPEISSIVLSQFDIDGNKNEGFIRLQDIYALNLNTDLVVLSSCESGVGKEIRGEGLLSINNAFLQAGAKSVLSSAWRVDDQATAELMKLFYQELVDKKLPPSEALRQAQIKLSENPQYSSPFYWAAFTVHGEFRNPVIIEKSYQSYYVLIGIVGILLTLFTAYLLKRKLNFIKN